MEGLYFEPKVSARSSVGFISFESSLSTKKLLGVGSLLDQFWITPVCHVHHADLFQSLCDIFHPFSVSGESVRVAWVT